jgi:hypothetical protein
MGCFCSKHNEELRAARSQEIITEEITTLLSKPSQEEAFAELNSSIDFLLDTSFNTDGNIAY